MLLPKTTWMELPGVHLEPSETREDALLDLVIFPKVMKRILTSFRLFLFDFQAKHWSKSTEKIHLFGKNESGQSLLQRDGAPEHVRRLWPSAPLSLNRLQTAAGKEKKQVPEHKSDL